MAKHLVPIQQQFQTQSKYIVSLIKWCPNRTLLLQIHSHIVTSNLISDPDVTLAFLSRSSSLRCLIYSRKFFDIIALPFRVHYDAIIRAYSASESSSMEGLRLYREMPRRGLSPNAFSTSFAVKCCLAGDLSLTAMVGVQIHARVVRDGHGLDSHLLTSLTEMYSKSERFLEARQVFDEIPMRDTVAWNVLISCFLRNGRSREALDLFEALRDGLWGSRPNEVSCLLAIQACSDLEDSELGERTHRYIEDRKFGDLNNNLKNSLVSMYSRCGLLEKARAVFAGITKKDMVSWTAMIAGFASSGLGVEAVEAFREMESSGVSPNEQTFSAVLSACSKTGLVEEGTAFFNRMVNEFGVSPAVQHYGYMVDLLCQAGRFDEVYRLVKSMKVDPDHHIWRALLGSCQIHEEADDSSSAAMEGLRFYCEMLRRGIPANVFFTSFAVKCCLAEAPLLSFRVGVQIHARVVRDGHGSDSHLLTSLTKMYSRSERFSEARRVFDEIPEGERDTVAWNILLSCYLRNNQTREALSLFELLRNGESGCEPDEVSCLLGIQACSDLNAPELGKKIHQYVMDRGFDTTQLKNSLVSMYSHCGLLEKARAVFSEITPKDVVSWTAMIAGFAQNSLGAKAIETFHEMESSGVSPNEQTFLAVLSACSRTGLINEGAVYFNQMVGKYKISPTVRHYGCLIDLLGRAGLLDEAYKLVKSMDVDPDPSVWRALLGSCWIHNRANIAEQAVSQLAEARAQEASDYVTLAQIHSSVGNWDKVRKARRLENENRKTKMTRGRSTVELDGVVHEFVTADSSHPRKREIYKKLDEIKMMLVNGGYVVDVSSELHTSGSKEIKERLLLYHSEKLALAFGALSAPRVATIRVAKKFRTCVDCHNFAKVFSRVYNREVVFRDRNRIHCFREGHCSCNDYW